MQNTQNSLVGEIRTAFENALKSHPGSTTKNIWFVVRDDEVRVESRVKPVSDGVQIDALFYPKSIDRDPNNKIFESIAEIVQRYRHLAYSEERHAVLGEIEDVVESAPRHHLVQPMYSKLFKPDMEMAVERLLNVERFVNDMMRDDDYICDYRGDDTPVSVLTRARLKREYKMLVSQLNGAVYILSDGSSHPNAKKAFWFHLYMVREKNDVDYLIENLSLVLHTKASPVLPPAQKEGWYVCERTNAGLRIAVQEPYPIYDSNIDNFYDEWFNRDACRNGGRKIALSNYLLDDLT